MEVEGAGLSVQRLLFEHSMQVPLLLAATLSESIDLQQILTAGGERVGKKQFPTISRLKLREATSGWLPKVGWEDAMIASVCIHFPSAILEVNPEMKNIAPQSWTSPVLDFNPYVSQTDINLPLPEMLTYLLLQHSSKKLASTYRQTADAKWPEENFVRSSAPDQEYPVPERKKSNVSSSPVLKAKFVHDLMRETLLISESIVSILQLIAASYGSPAQSEDVPLTKQQVDHLGFMISAGLDADGKQIPISKVFKQWQEDDEGKLPLREVAKTITKLLKTPKMDALAGEIFEVEHLEKKTLLKSGTATTPIDGRDVRIVDCTDSYIYILNAVRRISLIGCMDCTIFVGASTSLSVIGCGRVKVIATTRNCRVSNCVDTTLFLCTNQSPQVLGDTRAIVFAPYNASYDHFERDAKVVGVNPSDNRWDNFYAPISVTFGNVSSTPASAEAQAQGNIPASVVSLLPPEKFFPFVVPVAKDNEPKVSSGVTPAPQAAPLPAKYSEIIQKRTAEVDTMRKAVRNAQAKVSEENSNKGTTGPDLQSVVQEYFREWLITSGNLRQINDLMRLEEDLNETSGK